MGLQEKLVPIDQVEDDIVTVNVPFPSYVDRGGIGVNVSALRSFCEVLGIKRLAVDGSYDSEDEVPQIVGVNSNGEAVGGKASVGSSLYNVDLNGLDSHDCSAATRYYSLSVRLDLEGILSDINLRSVEAVAEVVNFNVKSALANAIKNLALSSPSQLDALIQLCYVTLCLSDFRLIPLSVLFGNVLLFTIENLPNLISGEHISDVRKTLLNVGGVEWDHYLRAYFGLKFRKIIAVIE